MANLVRAMLHRALDAFVREDADLALDVCRSDDAVASRTASSSARC
jgi:phosphate uptake regulator